MTMPRRSAHRRCSALIAALLASGCVRLTPAGSRVGVYRAPLDGPPASRRMPSGCSLLAAKPAVAMPELDLEGQKDPFRGARNEAGAAGANALLVLSAMTISRHDGDCPASSPITDCPPGFGAWFRVVLESYACTPEAIRQLQSQRETTTAFPD
jgi:hypothetical protein